MKKIEYVGLHRHTSYSSLDGFGKPEKQIVPRLKALGQKSCAITDHGSLFGHLDFYNVLTSNNLKPILGLEAYHVPDMRIKGKESQNKEKKGVARNEYAHITILAKDNKGYRNLMQLANISYSEGYYYSPRLDWNEIRKHQEGLMILSGCIIGRVSQLIIKDRIEDAYNYCKWAKQNIENFYIEIIPCPSLQDSYKASKWLWRIAEDLKIPTVLTDDAHFPNPEDSIAQDTVFCIGMNAYPKASNRKYKLPDYHYYCSGEDILERARIVLPEVSKEELLEAAKRTKEISDSVEVELPRSKGPTFPVAIGKSAKSQLQEWVDEGRAYRRSIGLLPPEDSNEWKVYVEREKHEWEIIEYHNFINYFLLITDIVRWAKSNDYWCIARGSAGGSLLCWYLGITQVDPIRFKLTVERFIDFSRKDMPDIDLDFDARHRDKVFDYLINKYGKDHCAQLGALSRFGPRAAIRDVGKAYRIPQSIIERILLLVPESDVDEGLKAEGVLEKFFEEDEEVKEILEKYPDLRIAASIEGQIRQSTVHAAGYIVNEEPLDKIVSVATFPKKNAILATDKEGAQRQGLLKFDALSVYTLAALKEMLESIGKSLEWLYSLPLDDPKAYQILAEGNNIGIFQLQGNAAGNLMRRIRPREFNDLLAIAALARPGPLQSGGAEEFVERRIGIDSIPNYHPKIMDIVKETYGVILFQEQVMDVAKYIGQFEMSEVHEVRKAVASIKGADVVNKFREAYLKGAKDQGIPEKDALHIWIQCLKAGNYSFNKAHGTQYALIAYWTAYFKAHYPALFTSIYAKWQKESDKEKRLRKRCKLFQEFRERGGKFLLPHYNDSKEDFTMIDDNTILGGFKNIDGCGEVIAAKLVEGQPYDSWDDFLSKCPKTIKDRIIAMGLNTGNIDLDIVLAFAPWYLEIEFNEYENKAFKALNCIPINQIKNVFYGEVRLMGKITGMQVINIAVEAKKYGGRIPEPHEPQFRAIITISDSTGSAEIYYNPMKYSQIVQFRNPFSGPYKGRANTIYALVNLSEDRQKLFAQDTILVRQAKDMPKHLTEKPKKRRISKKDLHKLEDQIKLEFELEISEAA